MQLIDGFPIVLGRSGEAYVASLCGLPPQTAFIEGGDHTMAKLLCQLARHLTGVDVVVAAADSVRLLPLMRPGRDLLVRNLEELGLVIENLKPGALRFVIITGNKESSVCKFSEIFKLCQSAKDVGAIRVLDMAWASASRWNAIEASRYTISDILFEIRALAEKGKLAFGP